MGFGGSGFSGFGLRLCQIVGFWSVRRPKAAGPTKIQQSGVTSAGPQTGFGERVSGNLCRNFRGTGFRRSESLNIYRARVRGKEFGDKNSGQCVVLPERLQFPRLLSQQIFGCVPVTSPHCDDEDDGPTRERSNATDKKDRTSCAPRASRHRRATGQPCGARARPGGQCASHRPLQHLLFFSGVEVVLTGCRGLSGQIWRPEPGSQQSRHSSTHSLRWAELKKRRCHAHPTRHGLQRTIGSLRRSQCRLRDQHHCTSGV